MKISNQVGPAANPGTEERMTVVVPTHNRPAELVRSLSSIVKQTIRPLEVIVIDDVGDKRVQAIAEGYSHEFRRGVRYVESEVATGSAPRSRNIGLAEVGTEYVAFLDDDDEWDPQCLSRMIFALTSGNEIVVVHSEIATRSSRRPFMRIKDGLEWSDCLANNPGITGSNFAARAETLRSVDGFDEELLVAEDQDLLVRMLLAGHPYAVVPEVLVTQHADGTEHLSSAGKRQSLGLRRFLHKHARIMDRRDKRYQLSMYHAASIYPGVSIADRIFHRSAQIIYMSPRTLLARLIFRIRGRTKEY